MKTKILLLAAALCITASLGAVNERSVYTERPDDPEAHYFTPEQAGFRADGKSDVSEALQAAIDRLKREKNFGILFIPEGKYRISRTIYIPAAIRLIGYGKERPEFILTKNAPGFREDDPADKGRSKYMFWFTGGLVEEGKTVPDANAGTFYSALSNINLRIEDGNPSAIALRTHFAQHSFISHVTIRTGKGRAGLFDVGNELENVSFYGGDYGILTTKASPGWPVMMTDCRFEGQRIAAVRSRESGLAMVNLQVKNVPAVFYIEDGFWEKFFVEDARFEQVSGPIVRIALENNANTSITFRNVVCSDAPVLATYPRTGETTRIPHRQYRIVSFDHGLQMDSMTDPPSCRTRLKVEPLTRLPEALQSCLPALPAMSAWTNVRDLGIVGDGVTDVSDALENAVAAYDVLYFPAGRYRLTRTLKMRPGTRLIGLHPYATQLFIDESTPAFSGFGSPVSLLESSEGGDDVLSGIGIDTGAYNYRATGVKWMAGANSYVNDVKFIGGHGNLWRPVPGKKEPAWWDNGPRRISSPSAPVREQGMDLAWDKQYWSLWVTRNGGGTFKDIWTASTYANAGFFAENTATPGRVYAMSIEHHVRNEVRLSNVSNWKIYCMQTEEENVEGSECQPIEMDGCDGITFANLYMFRVIRVNRPLFASLRVRGCKNIEMLNVHNYSQIKYTAGLAVYDQNKDLEVRPWEFSRLVVTGKERSAAKPGPDGVVRLAKDFEFTEGLARDGKSNVWFCENRMPRIWKWSPGEGLRLVADFPWKPYNLAFDSEDNLLVTFRYDRQPGFEGDTMDVSVLPDAHGTSFSGWGNSGFAVPVCTMDPERPAETLALLPLRSCDAVPLVDKALYPSNRWRDFHDFDNVVLRRPEKCFVAPDGKTVIPQVYDLARSSSLVEAFPGQPLYVSDEYGRRTVRLDVAADGSLSNRTLFAETGEFGVTTDADGNVYIADGQVQVYAPDGSHLRTIRVPERPSTLAVAGDRLFITGRSALFSVPVSPAEATGTKHGDPDEKVLIAYVFRMNTLPDATYLTHINYAFGHVNATFDGVRLDTPDELHRLVGIKADYPHVKILLSIGGWGSGNFSEMCGDPALRASFAKDCRRVVDEFGLDGIDIDWEYPGEDVAQISCSPDDIGNYTLLMRDIRAAIGPDKLLTHATAGSGKFYDFKALDAYIDWTNVMSYDLGWAPYHNSPLYPSEFLEPESMSVSQCVQAHLDAGVPPEKLVLGLPFGGHGAEGFPRGVDLTKAHLIPGYTYHWDAVGQVPYLTDDATGAFAFGYENEKSLRIKALFAVEKGFKGAMYWSYNGDNEAGDLRRTVYRAMNGTLPTPGVRQRPGR